MANELHDIDLNRACRICRNECEDHLKVYIFEENESTSLCESISLCSGLIITHNDGLPAVICRSCELELKSALLFIERCKESDKYFRKYYTTSPIKDESKSINNLVIKDEKHEIKTNDLNENAFKLHYNYIKKENDVHLWDDNTDNISESNIKHGKVSAPIKKKKHKNKSDRKSQIQCNECGLHCQSRSALICHLRTHSGEKPYTCSNCSQSFSQKSTLKIHIARRHLNQKFPSTKKHACDKCGKLFSTTTNLKIHTRIHTGERPYTCDLCPKKFIQLSSLNSHRRRHLGEKPHRCEYCGRAFVEIGHLKRHYVVHTDNKPFTCTTCGKNVKTQFALKHHMQLHSDSKDYICDKCGMSFKIVSNLASHIRSVHSDRSGQCTICDKLFSNLEMHMIIHSGEKKYQCDICKKLFAHKRGLIVHGRQHSSANKFKCTVDGCTKSFFAQWILDCHIMKHTGHTPYVCKFCSKGFLRICHLTQHLKLHHPNENVQCYKMKVAENAIKQ